MASDFQYMLLVSVLGSCLAGGGLPAFATDSGAVGHHAEQSFEQLEQKDHRGLTTSNNTPRDKGLDHVDYSPDQYVIGNGQGDMAKGPIICQRVSELSARTDLAKQIRVLVKEHMIDRVRERSGRNSDQDIELTREEIVQEYLQGVKIVDRRIDEQKHTCSATAVMPRSRIDQLQPGADRLQSAPATTR